MVYIANVVLNKHLRQITYPFMEQAGPSHATLYGVLDVCLCRFSYQDWGQLKAKAQQKCQPKLNVLVGMPKSANKTTNQKRCFPLSLSLIPCLLASFTLSHLLLE